MPITICEIDLTKLMEGDYKPKALTKIGKTPIKVVLNDKKIIDVVDSDPLLQQQLVDTGQEVIERAATDAARQLKDWDQDAQKRVERSGRAADAAAFADGFATVYKRLADDAGDDVDKALKATWKKYTATNKEYKRYKWSSKITIAMGVVGAGASIAGAVGAAATANPIACAASIVAAMKAVSKSLQTYRNYRKDAGAAYKDLTDGLEKVKKAYVDFNKSQKTGREVAASAADQLLTAQIPSLRTSEKHLKTFRKKLKGLDVETHKISKELNTALKNSHALAKGVEKNLPEELKKKLDSDVKKLENSVSEGIASVGKMLDRIKGGEGDADAAQKTIDTLMSGVDESVVKNANRFFATVTIALDVWGGNIDAGEFGEPLAIAGYCLLGAETIKESIEDHFGL